MPLTCRRRSLAFGGGTPHPLQPHLVAAPLHVPALTHPLVMRPQSGQGSAVGAARRLPVPVTAKTATVPPPPGLRISHWQAFCCVTRQPNLQG